jgi:hypothetical protein
MENGEWRMEMHAAAEPGWEIHDPWPVNHLMQQEWRMENGN